MTEEQQAELDALIHNHSTAVCLSMIGEVEEANKKWPPGFNSNAEALGVIRDMYLDVEREFLTTKSITSPESNRLKDRLKRLGAMCIKATYSRCDMKPEMSAINEYLAIQGEEGPEAE
jgi:hypothetical protein